MAGAVRDGEGEEVGEEKGRTEATEEEEVELKGEEENNKELEQQEKEAELREEEIREVSRSRKAPKKRFRFSPTRLATRRL